MYRQNLQGCHVVRESCRQSATQFLSKNLLSPKPPRDRNLSHHIIWIEATQHESPSGECCVHSFNFQSGWWSLTMRALLHPLHSGSVLPNLVVVEEATRLPRTAILFCFALLWKLQETKRGQKHFGRITTLLHWDVCLRSWKPLLPLLLSKRERSLQSSSSVGAKSTNSSLMDVWGKHTGQLIHREAWASVIWCHNGVSWVASGQGDGNDGWLPLRAKEKDEEYWCCL